MIFLHRYKKLIFTILIVEMIVLLCPILLVQGLTNAASLAFAHVTMADSEAHQTSPGYSVSSGSFSKPNDSFLAQSASLLDIGVRYFPASTHLVWDLARINLAMNRAAPASGLLPLSDQRLGIEPLRYLDTLIAHSRAGNHQAIIDMYESTSQPSEFQSSVASVFTKQVNDLVALAYLERAREQIAAGDEASSMHYLQQALQKRPGDLYAHYNLFKLLTRWGQMGQGDLHRQNVIQFSESGLEFSDPRLVDMTAEAILQIVGDGLWMKTTALNVAATLAWRNPSSAGTIHLLQRLAENHPNEPEWLSFLGEALKRNGQPQVMQENASRPNAPSESNVYPTVPIDQQIVANLLAVPQGTIQLGPNMLPNSGFEDVTDGRPSDWKGLALSGSLTHDRALFYSGLDSVDPFSGMYSARVGGLWTGTDGSLARPNAGFWLWNEASGGNRLITLEPGETYALSFRYRTEWTEDKQTAVYLNLGTDPFSSFGGEHYLPATDGSWQEAILIGSVGQSAQDYSVSPFLRLWGMGQVWFDDVELRKVSFLSPHSVLPQLVVLVQ